MVTWACAWEGFNDYTAYHIMCDYNILSWLFNITIAYGDKLLNLINCDSLLHHKKEVPMKACNLYNYKELYFYHKKNTLKFIHPEDKRGFFGLNGCSDPKFYEVQYILNFLESIFGRERFDFNKQVYRISDTKPGYSIKQLLESYKSVNSYQCHVQGFMINNGPCCILIAWGSMILHIKQIQDAHYYLLALEELQKMIQTSATYCPECKSPLSARSIELTENGDMTVTFECSDCHLTFKNK